MKIAYARVSTEEQNLDRQLKVLDEFGYDKLITEKFTGTKGDREGIIRLKDMAREDDIIIVESISRLGRRTTDILNLMEYFKLNGIKFISLKEKLDTTSAAGTAMMQIFCVMAELERNLIAERIKEGQAASKKRGKHIGRPKVSPEKVRQALTLYDSGEWSIKEITEEVGISQGKLYKEINKRKYKV
ncbi:recombinase family protein [Pseudalkalibacillus sp. JSM 102089]|uniref:recombinase family protein n=1 Tax=Pseudalkalibacillus sp. JSM 102089 TaxID=3229856 RepID=UPI0035264376